MQITDLQADLRIEVRKPRKVRKELRVLVVCLVALYYKVGHERPETIFFNYCFIFYFEYWCKLQKKIYEGTVI
jgi:hypothetical protein